MFVYRTILILFTLANRFLLNCLDFIHSGERFLLDRLDFIRSGERFLTVRDFIIIIDFVRVGLP